jgi:hypothetical protein
MVTLDSLDAKIDRLLGALDTKFEEKIDDLARMVARGFREVDIRFDKIEHRLEVVEENYATKDDLLALSKNVDLMFDKHIGIFRKDYDELAARTKNLEKAVFATS